MHALHAFFSFYPGDLDMVCEAWAKGSEARMVCGCLVTIHNYLIKEDITNESPHRFHRRHRRSLEHDREIGERSPGKWITRLEGEIDLHFLKN